MISVTLFGAGNVGMHLFKAFHSADNVSVNQWFNRDLKQLQPYKNDVEITSDLLNLKSSDIYILAISDDAIANFSKQLKLDGQLVVHTSGSVNMRDLNKRLRRGVFYPLQTFSKDVEMDFENVPICIEALEKDDFNLLKQLAESIGSPSYKINTEQRQTLHLAAVFLNNFSNQLYRIGHEISDVKNINFDILKPLILETAKKVQTISPYKAQTGPAKRHDKKTIKRHIKALDNKMHKDIYELLTNSIKQTHGKKL